MSLTPSWLIHCGGEGLEPSSHASAQPSPHSPHHKPTHVSQCHSLCLLELPHCYLVTPGCHGDSVGGFLLPGHWAALFPWE